jgi:hydroxysqualene synthase
MSDAGTLSSGKGHHDENFPVASYLIAPRHRQAILAFYNFVRTADDVADNPSAPQEMKLRLLEDMRLTLMGASDVSPEGVALRRVLEERKLTTDHAADLLEAFRRDVVKLRYANWSELMDYCRYSAMPVGRYVLDVHGESRDCWPLNDALCAALQVINHLQDCAKDYRDLNRVYLPLDTLDRHGTSPEALSAHCASPDLRAAIAELAGENARLLRKSAAFAGLIRDMRLGMEVAVIQKFAEDLNIWLQLRDPLSQRVHHRRSEQVALVVSALPRFLLGRLGPKSRP